MMGQMPPKAAKPQGLGAGLGAAGGSMGGPPAPMPPEAPPDDLGMPAGIFETMSSGGNPYREAFGPQELTIEEVQSMLPNDPPAGEGGDGLGSNTSAPGSPSPSSGSSTPGPTANGDNKAMAMDLLHERAVERQKLSQSFQDKAKGMK